MLEKFKASPHHGKSMGFFFQDYVGRKEGNAYCLLYWELLDLMLWDANGRFWAMCFSWNSLCSN